MFQIFITLLILVTLFKLYLTWQLDAFFDVLQQHPNLYQQAGRPSGMMFLFSFGRNKFQLYRFFRHYQQCPENLIMPKQAYQNLRRLFMIDFMVLEYGILMVLIMICLYDILSHLF